MARNQENGADGGDSDQAQILQAGEQKEISLPDNGFLADSDLVRDGQDLVLRAPDGETIVIEGYFSTLSAPLLTTADGGQLTPSLVDSFVRYDGPTQYASGETLNDASPVGMVKEVSGAATITHASGMTETAVIGTAIYQGDIVETDGVGAVNIRFLDESTFAVSNNARLAIDEYVFDAGNTGAGASNFSLLRGVFMFTSGLIGRDDPDDVRIETPVGSIGIRGTTIFGVIDPNGESQITVTEGAIVVRNGTGERTLSNQNDTVTLSGFNDEIVYDGQAEQTQITQDYNVLRVVSPDDFAGMDEEFLSEEESGVLTQDTLSAPLPDTTSEQDTSTQDAPVSEPTQEEVVPEDGAALLPEAEDATFDEALDFTGTDNVFEVTATQDSTDTLLSSSSETVYVPPSSTSSTVTISSSTTTTYSTDTTAPPSITSPAGTAPVVPTGLNLLTIGGLDGFYIAGATTSGERLGDVIATWGDRDHNGSEDFLVANNKTVGGQVFTYDGGLNALSGIPGSPSLAPEVAGIGDFDGDGVIDFVIGAPNSNLSAAGGGGATISASLAPATLIISTAANQEVGHSVAGIGDINGDGYSDVLIGASGTAADTGAAYVVYGSATVSASIDITAMGTDGFAITGIAASDLFGSESSSAGDFNNDGFSDFAMSEPGQGRVHVAFGGAGVNGVTLGGGTLQINGIVVDGADPEIPISHVGDFNGDGISDMMVAATGANGGKGEGYIVYGKNSYAGGSILDVTTMTAADGVKIGVTNTGSKLDGGGAAGDFNGDGLDDVAVVLRTGNIADIYVVYGTSGGGGNLTDVDLTNPLNAFHMSYDVGSTAPFDFVISSAGDLDGDGFDDLAIGTPDAGGGDGGFMVVYGRDDNGTLNTTGFAAAAGDHLIGTAGMDSLSTNGFGNVRMNAGGGDDILVVDNTALAGVDGGTGFDTLQLTGVGKVLDFTNSSANTALRGSEALSGIEEFKMMDSGQTIKLSLDDIFSLLQQSSDGTLRFLENGAGGNVTNLVIDDNDTGSGTLAGQAGVLGFAAAGTDAISEPGVTFDVYTFGTGYQLLIDQNIDSTTVV